MLFIENKLRNQLNDVSLDTRLKSKTTNYSFQFRINFAQNFNTENSTS